MFKFFKKRKRKLTVIEALNFISKNPSTKFHLNFLRNDLMEIQVYNQSFNVNDKYIAIDNEKGFTLVFTFCERTIELENSLKRFNRSFLKKDSFFFSLQDKNDKCAYNMDFNIDKLNEILRVMTEEIYCYTNDTKNIIEFFIIKDNGKVLNIDYSEDLASIFKN